jgi:hypothetical protein
MRGLGRRSELCYLFGHFTVVVLVPAHDQYLLTGATNAPNPACQPALDHLKAALPYSSAVRSG